MDKQVYKQHLVEFMRELAKDATEYGDSLNEAGWEFLGNCPEKSALLFNNCKQPLRLAILKYLELEFARLNNQDGWTPVKEGLPENNLLVETNVGLAYVSSKHPGVWFRYLDGIGVGTRIGAGSVTKWRPVKDADDQTND